MEIDGICDTPLDGDTFEEWYVNRLRHLEEASVIYPEHKKILYDIQFMSALEKERQAEEFKKVWDEAHESA
jgi:hypothetical protein